MSKWNSLKEFFLYLNEKCEYVILRNWDTLEDETPYKVGHEDVDILCADLGKFISISGAKKIHALDTRNNYVIEIAGKNVRFDIRFVGDGYYDENWERSMIVNRVKYCSFYIMDEEDFKYSLVYHAMVQKQFVSDDYGNKLKGIFDSNSASNTMEQKFLLEALVEYCNQNNYHAEIPSDPGVIFNKKNALAIGIKHNIRREIKRMQFRLMMKLHMNV